MRRSYPLLLALLAAASTLGALHAQTASVSIPAWVEEGECGRTPKFEATFNGKPASVISQLGPGSDQIILLVLDFTGEASLVEAAKQALAAEISKLPPNAWVGLLRDQDGLHVLADPSPNRQPLLDAIKSLASTGKPGLFETVTPALSLADSLMRKSPVRVSVLYITDSNIYNYREDYTNPVINGSDPHDLSRVFPDALIQDKISKLDGRGQLAGGAPVCGPHQLSRRYAERILSEWPADPSGCHGRQRAGVPLGGGNPRCDRRGLYSHFERLAADSGSASQVSQQRANPSECPLRGRGPAAFLAYAPAPEGGLMRPLICTNYI